MHKVDIESHGDNIPKFITIQYIMLLKVIYLDGLVDDFENVDLLQTRHPEYKNNNCYYVKNLQLLKRNITFTKIRIALVT